MGALDVYVGSRDNRYSFGATLLVSQDRHATARNTVSFYTITDFDIRSIVIGCKRCL